MQSGDGTERVGGGMIGNSLLHREIGVRTGSGMEPDEESGTEGI